METILGKFIPEKFLVDSINLSLFKLLAIVLTSILLSSGLTHLVDTTSLPKAQALAPVTICPVPITCPIPKPRAHWERRWKATPNNDGQKF